MCALQNITTVCDRKTAAAQACLSGFLAKLFAEPCSLEGGFSSGDLENVEEVLRFLNLTRLQEHYLFLKQNGLRDFVRKQQFYYHVFGFVPKSAVPLFATEYFYFDIFRQTQKLADMGAFYRACGLRMEKGERADHLEVQLNFLWFLWVRLTLTWEEKEGAAHRVVLEEMYKKFFDEFFRTWIFAFSEKVENFCKEKSDLDFYRGAARFLREWVLEECRRLQLPSTGGVPTPQDSPPPFESDCEACPMAF